VLPEAWKLPAFENRGKPIVGRGLNPRPTDAPFGALGLNKPSASPPTTFLLVTFVSPATITIMNERN
jgi:hypothetical protein